MIGLNKDYDFGIQNLQYLKRMAQCLQFGCLEQWLNRVVREPEVWGMTAYESPVLGQGQVTFDQVRPLSGRLPAWQNISFHLHVNQVRIMPGGRATITLIDKRAHSTHSSFYSLSTFTFIWILHLNWNFSSILILKAEKSFPVRKSCVFWVHPTGAPKNETSLFNLSNVLATLFLLIREAFKKKKKSMGFMCFWSR